MASTYDRPRTNVRLGVAGLGRIGLLHADHLFGHVPHADLQVVADVSADRARSVADRLGVKWTTEVDSLVTDPDLDALVIATPTPTHPSYVEGAARAGKAIFCEKPLGLNEAATRAVISTVETLGVPLQVGLHRRFDPDTRYVRHLIAAGELGNLFSFRTSLRDMVPQPIEYIRESGSFFVDVTIHDLDLARWLIGEIVEVSVSGASVSDPGYAEMGTVDHAVVVVRFESGALGVIDNSRIAGYGYEASTEVVGSNAAVRIEHSERTGVTLLCEESSRRDHVTDFVERFREAYRAELEDFVDAVRHGRQVAVTGADALAAFTLAQACDLSHRTGAPVRLEADRAAGRIEYKMQESALRRSGHSDDNARTAP